MTVSDDYSAPIRTQREQRQGHQGVLIWFTGLSGAGKSTLAQTLNARLFAMGHQSYVLDGDQLREGLNVNLGFSPADRAENVRRVGEVARLMVDAGLITIAALISPFAADRAAVRARFAADDFIEVWCSTPLATCEARDPKGLYAKARAGLVRDFTGVSSPYETPINPELTLDATELSCAHVIDCIVKLLQQRGVFP